MMVLKRWDELPENMKTDAVRPYYNNLKKKVFSLFLKRGFDLIVSFLLLIILSPIFIILAFAITRDSKGDVFFRQERVTQYGRKFRIHKFRTMVLNAENKGSQVTIKNDMRVTKVGKKLRKYRLDEIPQLIDILFGDMSFVGTRPEVVKYVNQYTSEMMATLLLPAGITSEASIQFKDEDRILETADNVDNVYVTKVLPMKMKYNLESLDRFSLLDDLCTMIKTVLAVLKKDDIENIAHEDKGEAISKNE